MIRFIFHAILNKNYLPTIFLIIILFLLTGCKTAYPWKKPLHLPFKLPKVFNRANIIGTGLRISNNGYLAKTCLKNLPLLKTGGILDVEFYRIDEENRPKIKDLKFSTFVKKNFRRTILYNIDDEKILAFALKITINNRTLSLKEEKIKFRKNISKMILEKKYKKFFTNCGTQFVYSLTFDSTFFLFVGYYLSAKNDMTIFKNIEKRISKNSADLRQINIFENLSFNSKSFFSLQVGSGVFFIPQEFTFSSIHGKQLNDLFKKVTNSILESNIGTVKSFRFKPWTSLYPVKKMILTEKKQVSISSKESVFNSIQILHDRLQEFLITAYQVKTLKEKKIFKEKKKIKILENSLKIVNRHLQVINWRTFISCKEKAWQRGFADLRKIRICDSLQKELKNYYQNSTLKDLQKFSQKAFPLINLQINKPSQLTHLLVKNPLSLNREQTDYRFRDIGQIKKIPELMTLGQPIDIHGKYYSNECIKKETMKFSIMGSGDIGFFNNYFPFYKKEKWNFFNKNFFGKAASKKDLNFRGSFEVIGYSQKLLPNFKLKEKALRLAQLDLKEFYRKYGTHYVSEVKHRRGFVYYFSLNLKKQKENKIIPYGIIVPKNIPPKLNSKTIKNFFQKKLALQKYLTSPENAIPLGLNLEPWNEYFLINGILTSVDLDLN